MTNYKIPHIIHYTFCSNDKLPQEVKNVIAYNKNICKQCEFRFYDDAACDEFIKNNFHERIYQAYQIINPKYGAMRADFFRYCVLFKIGGIYVDIKSRINVPIFSLIRPQDICILDIPRITLEPWRRKLLRPTYEQWVLIFAPGHPYLLSMITYMTRNIHRRYQPRISGYGQLTSKQKVLHITGPDAFARVIHTYIRSSRQKLHRNINYDRFFQLHPPAGYKQMYTMNGKQHYSNVHEPLYLPLFLDSKQPPISEEKSTIPDKEHTNIQEEKSDNIAEITQENINDIDYGSDTEI